MARIGCICLPATGHINPLSTLALELAERGHEVVFFSIADYEETLRARGLQVCRVAPEGFPIGAMRERERALGGLTGLEASLGANQQFLRYFDAFLTESVETVAGANVDFLLVDQADYAGCVVAQALWIPFATVALALMLNEDDPKRAPWNPIAAEDTDSKRAYLRKTWESVHRHMSRPVMAVLNGHRERFGLAAVKTASELWSGLVQITQQPKGFEFPRKALPEHFHFTGPFHKAGRRVAVAFDYGRLDGRPLVYAAFGTIVNREMRLLQQIAEGCAGLGVQLLISLGGAPGETPGLAGDPLVVEYAPQLEILKRAALMITHAGLNSALECLANGVPMVAVPITLDQPAVAARVAACGAGVVVNYVESSGAVFRDAVSEVLLNPEYRAAARRMQKEIAAGNGLRRAADIVEGAIAAKSARR